MKKISVVLPVYNGSRTIAKAVASVLSQTYKNLELIIVNDCSSDNTLEIIEALATKDDRIKIRNNEHNMKLPISLNNGFELATGEYYTWTSDDNVYKENALEVLANVLDNNEDVDLVYSDFNIVEADGSIRSEEKKSEPEMLKFINCVGACFMYRKTLADKIGVYDPEMFLAEDYEYWIRAYLSGKLMHITDNLYDYGWHDKSLTVTRREEVAHKTFEAKDKHLNELYFKCKNDEERIRFFYDMLEALTDEEEKRSNEKRYFKMCNIFKKCELNRKKKEKQNIAREDRLRIKAQLINRIKRFVKWFLKWPKYIFRNKSRSGFARYTGNYYSANRPGQKLNKNVISDCIKPLVTIVTPFYNAGTFFEETYNSVINQTFPWFEWIIVDDGSTDKASIDVLGKFVKTDSRIQVIHQENQGLAGARNAGFNAASTELVVPLDADDLIAPTFLDYLYWALKYNPNAAWAYCDTVGFSGQEYVWKKSFDAEIMKSENLLVATAMIRKSAYNLIGGYKVEKYSYNEDWRFWLELLSAHQFPVHVNANLFWYRRQTNSMLSEVKNDKQKIELNKRLIGNAQKGVDTNVKAVEYPEDIKHKKLFFEHPNEIEWHSKQGNGESFGRKVLWIIPWLSLGGADKFNLDAISGLTKKAYKNIVVCTKPSKNEWLTKFELITDEIYSLSDFMSMEHYPEFITYLIRTRDIDEIIVSNSTEGYAVLPFIRQLYPMIPIIDYVHMEEWRWHGGGYARTSGNLAGLVDKTLVCNTSTRDVMVEFLKADDSRTKCLHIGVDYEYFDPLKEEGGYLHQMLGLLREAKIVLFPCRICAQKRPFMMLDIAEYVKTRNHNVAFVVIGEGSDLAEIKKAIVKRKLSNTVYCIGSSDEMRKCYKDSDVLLICSTKEGLALTTYEACSMGVPVVSSNVGGQRDLVNPSNGYLIDVPMEEQNGNQKWSINEVEQFGDAILDVLSDSSKATNLGNNGRKEVIEKFGITKMIDALSNELDGLLDDAERREIRLAQSAALKTMPNLAGEFYAVNCRWEMGELKGRETLSILLIRKIKHYLKRLFAV